MESGAVTLEPFDSMEEKEEKKDNVDSAVGSTNDINGENSNGTVENVEVPLSASVPAVVDVAVDVAVVLVDMIDTLTANANTENIVSENIGFDVKTENDNDKDENNEDENRNKTEVINGKVSDVTASIITVIPTDPEPDPELKILTFDEFSSALNPLNKFWTQKEDEIIATLVNRISDKMGLDPLMISSSILEEKRKKMGLLPDRSSHEVQARYSALCVLNKVSSRAA